MYSNRHDWAECFANGKGNLRIVVAHMQVLASIRDMLSLAFSVREDRIAND